VPLVVGVEPADGFRDWLLDRIGHDDPLVGTDLSRVVGADVGRPEGNAARDEPR
jgi:hypothetical protein